MAISNGNKISHRNLLRDTLIMLAGLLIKLITPLLIILLTRVGGRRQDMDGRKGMDIGKRRRRRWKWNMWRRSVSFKDKKIKKKSIRKERLPPRRRCTNMCIEKCVGVELQNKQICLKDGNFLLLLRSLIMWVQDIPDGNSFICVFLKFIPEQLQGCKGVN